MHTAIVRGAILCALLAPGVLHAQTMTIEQYKPRSTLHVPETLLTRAKFPFVDVHSHQGNLTAEQVDVLAREMDAMNMAVLVDLSGGSGEQLARKVKTYRARHPNRFVVFANIDFSGIDEPGWSERATRQLEEDVRVHGAAGLKIFKNLGMDVRDSRGRVPTNDPRLDPIWAKAGELGIPVLIHTAEPASFFEPHDSTNERWLELKIHPSRARPPDRYPSWETLMEEQWSVFRKHPGTMFISAHLSWLGNDLERLGTLLDEMPNMYVELGAVIYEIGRQPRFASRFFAKYQDRIMMGKDAYRAEEFNTYFRVLETADEYFDYYRDYHAFWKNVRTRIAGRNPAEGVLRERAPGDTGPRSITVREDALKHNPAFLRAVDDARSRIEETDVDTVRQRLDAGDEFQLVDVREDSEWEKGHLPGAIHIGKGVIERDIEKLIPDTSAEIILYCGGGFRSAIAADSLQKMGYTNVKSMDGGFRGWTEKGLPVVGS